MKQIFLKPIIAMGSAARSLFKSRQAMALMFAAFTGMLLAGWLFVSTREATIPQLVLTMTVVVIAPALFFVLQAASVTYTTGPLTRELVRNCLRLIVVTVPVIGIAALGAYGLSKVNSWTTVVTASRYLLIGVVAPLLAIQLWVAVSGDGLRSLLRKLRRVAAQAFTPQALIVYVCGFMIFAVIPYVLITLKISSERAWLEFSFLMLRLSTSALLILLGWVTTVGAISILSRDANEK